ncbi:cellulose binding domain-containing protein [Chondromyces crocatus]|uniref:Hydrolase n=1 Tax=Chondromyces crocatus TaxID=52 RepID=A0A0K1EAH7_CHOCO|nr:cellulose binding domain-containing protein [Chondromyces crocatus]AKT37563.1 hydrolase [Chondromyces crocatus]
MDCGGEVKAVNAPFNGGSMALTPVRLRGEAENGEGMNGMNERFERVSKRLVQVSEGFERVNERSAGTLGQGSGGRRGRVALRALAVVSLLIPGLVAQPKTSAAGPTDLTVEYLNYDAAAPYDGIIEAGIRLRNDTASAIPLSSIVVRYWFTRDGASTVNSACWWWGSSPCPNLTTSVHTVSLSGADRYVEIGFTSGAGSLAPGATTLPVDLGITFGGVNVDETNDYSYANQTAFGAWSRITVHDVGSAPTGGVRGGTPPGGGPVTVAQEFFDDFTYTGNTDANFLNRWNVRSGGGGPGISGAQWSTSNVSMVTDPANGSNRLMRLQGSTNGTSAGTSQAEVISDDRKFRFGTYASRMRFNDAPLHGSRFYADKPIETFFTITPWTSSSATDPNYSEQDFEYMPNGGWGQGNVATMWLTSWETAGSVQNVDKRSDLISASHNGWHTLVLQVSTSGIVYFIDGGAPKFTHAAMFAPETNQFLAFQVWYDQIDTAQSSSRAYFQETDWVYFAKDTILTPAQVDSQVAALRGAAVAFRDTVP